MSLFDLSGRTALVTGSNRGIGQALAMGLAQHGANIIVHCARNIDQAQQVAGEIRTLGVKSIAIKANLSEPEVPKQLYREAHQHFKHIDILVLNASAQINKSWQEITQEDFECQMNVNVRASMELMQHFIPHMVERKWGRILTVGSVQQVKPHPKTLIYAASKDAQMSIVRNLAKQYASDGITINNLAPGFIDTDRNTDAIADDAYLKQVLARIPSGTVGNTEDCVGASLLLCSEAGRYITGVNLIADGGMHL